MPVNVAPGADFGRIIAAWTGRAAVGGTTVDATTLGATLSALRDDLFAIGVEPGDFVFVAGGQHPDMLAAVAASIDLGAMAAPIGALTAPALLEDLIRTTGPVGIIVTRERAKAVSRAFTGNGRDLSGGRLVYLAAPNPARSAAPVGCLGLVSSGTTGTPKIVTHQPQSAILNAILHANSIGMHPGERLLMTLPVHFSFGFVACLLGAMASGTDIVFEDPAMTPAVFAAMVAATRATLYSATPSMIRRVVADGPLPAGLGVVSIGGDAMPADEVKHLRERFNGRLFLTYGLSEAGPRAFTREVLRGDVAPFDLGRPLDGIMSRLAPLPPDRTVDVLEGQRAGELVLLTPTAMLGLWERGGLNRRDFNGNWLHTGDICIEDPSGRLFFHDRMKNVIVSGGEKISFGLIQRVLLEHEAVAAARIWAEPDAVLGQIPMAAVRLNETYTGREADALRDLEAWNARRLRRLERPRRITTDNSLAINIK